MAYQCQWERTSDISGVARARADFDEDGMPNFTLELRVNCSRTGNRLGCSRASSWTKK